jgi:hypothetical protein
MIRLMPLLLWMLLAPATVVLVAEQHYEGTQEAGGVVILSVQAEPAQIVLFEIDGVAGGGCSWDTITLENWGGPIDVVDDRFSATNADGDVLEGAWISREPADTRIEGTLQVRDPVKGCETPPLRWVATAMPLP